MQGLMTSQELSNYESDLATAEIDQTDREIDAVKEKCAKLRACLNQFRAPTSFLPPDALSLIFQHACALPPLLDEDDPHFPIILGSVSKHWRHVAWSTPSLWTAIVINVGHAQYASPNTLSLLRLYLDNFGRHYMSIRIYVPEEAEDGDEDESQKEVQGRVPVKELWDMLFRYREVIKEFFCDYFWSRWWSIVVKSLGPNLDGKTTIFPNLKFLHLGIPGDPELPGAFAVPGVTAGPALPPHFAPQLFHVSLMTRIPPVTLPCQQLTVLALEDIPVDRCIALLKKCPNLTDYAYDCRNPSETSNSEPLLEAPLVLEHMGRFGWAFGYNDWDYVLLTQVQLLIVLHIRIEAKHEACDYDGIRAELGAAHKIFWASLTTLEVLERGSTRIPWIATEDLLKWLPSSLKELHFWDVGDCEGDDIVNALTCDKSGQENILPGLNTLSLVGIYVNTLQNHARSVSSLLYMLRLRRGGSVTRLDSLVLGCKRRRRENVTEEDLSLSESQEAELQKIVDGGMRLVTTDSEGNEVIWQESQPVPS
jgi:hypothetical protein